MFKTNHFATYLSMSIFYQVLVKAVEDATGAFIDRGIEIARENPELRAEMEEAIEDTKRDGEVMSRTSHAFAEDPCSSMKV